MSEVWVFQAVPKRYRILDALRDPNLQNDVWEVKQYKNSIHEGHLGLIWKGRTNSTSDMGIYAVVDIVSEPAEMYDSEQSTQYWVNREDRHRLKQRVRIRRKLILLDNPITKPELMDTPTTSNLEIITRKRGTNFKVAPNEWETILDLIRRRVPEFEP
jgi:hypothetical protein